MTMSFCFLIGVGVIGLIDTGRATRRTTQCKQMGPVVLNGIVHTARKQHQRICGPICVRIASCVMCELYRPHVGDHGFHNSGPDSNWVRTNVN